MQYKDLVEFSRICRLATFGDNGIFRTIPKLRKRGNPFVGHTIEKVTYGSGLGLYHYGAPLLQHIADAQGVSINDVTYEFDASKCENWLVKPIVTTDMRFAYYLRRNAAVWSTYLIDGRWATQKENEILDSFDSKPFNEVTKQLNAGVELDKMVLTKRPKCSNVVYYANCDNTYVAPNQPNFGAMLDNLTSIQLFIDWIKISGVKHTFDTDL